MSILSRYMRVPIRVYSVRQKELTGKEECEDSYMKMNPFDISRYYPTTDPEHNNCDCVRITFKDGESTVIYLTMEQFEKRLELFFQS
jgi:hypothetical protein